MSDESEGDMEQHYTACRDCEMYSWRRGADEAERAAKVHSTRCGHDAYAAKTEVVL